MHTSCLSVCLVYMGLSTGQQIKECILSSKVSGGKKHKNSHHQQKKKKKKIE